MHYYYILRKNIFSLFHMYFALKHLITNFNLCVCVCARLFVCDINMYEMRRGHSTPARPLEYIYMYV